MELLRDEKPDHEKLFDEICGKLNQLSQRTDTTANQERISRVHANLQKSQEDLKIAQVEIQQKIKSMESHSIGSHDFGKEIKRLSEQLEYERASCSKLSTDLAKSLELNLKLQFEIEEVRSKMTQALNEEKKHNQYLSDRNKNLSHEIELAEALNKETKAELAKAKELISQLGIEIQENAQRLEQRDTLLEQMRQDLESRLEDIQQLTNSLEQFESHTHNQNEVLKNLSEVAEQKMVELKISLDKKTIECQDYYSHLQQAMSQAAVLKQENAAMKDYISKISNLQQRV